MSSSTVQEPNGFGIYPDYADWLSREVPALGAGWLDVAEQRLHELAEVEHAYMPPHVAGLLAEDGRTVLRLSLLLELTAEDLEPVPGGCEIPWTGCPEHGDTLALRGIEPGWYCEGDPESRDHYGQDTTFGRLRHCRQPAVAVLHADGHELAVCSGHRSSEMERGSEIGEVFTVTDIDRDTNA